MTYQRIDRTRIFSGATYSVEVRRRAFWRDWAVTVVSNSGAWDHRLYDVKTARGAVELVRRYTAE